MLEMKVLSPSDTNRVSPSHTIQGIKFFDNRDSCISHFKETPWTKRIVSFVQSFGTFFTDIFYRIRLVYSRTESQVNLVVNPRDFTKKRLVVCLHGLNRDPSQFNSILDEVQKRDLTNSDIFVPKLLQKGNATLDQIVDPIFKEIAKWEKPHGDKELVLVGISNGGRIARAIEARITALGNQQNIKKIQVVSIVGACKGSSLATLANKLHLSWLMSKNISKEMPTNSKSNNDLQTEWSMGLKNYPEIEHEYTFIASPHDWQIPNYDSTLPDVEGKKALYALVPGHGHNSIVNAAASAVAEIIFP